MPTTRCGASLSIGCPHHRGAATGPAEKRNSASRKPKPTTTDTKHTKQMTCRKEVNDFWLTSVAERLLCLCDLCVLCGELSQKSCHRPARRQSMSYSLPGPSVLIAPIPSGNQRTPSPPTLHRQTLMAPRPFPLCAKSLPRTIGIARRSFHKDDRPVRLRVVSGFCSARAAC